MGIWKKIFGDSEEAVDYYAEGVELLNGQKFHEALTSFKLALREDPGDVATLQQMAIAYTRIGMTDEAMKTYRAVLSRDDQSAGAHYGLAFLLLHVNRTPEALKHLRLFLNSPPTGPEAERHIEHARSKLAELEQGGG